MTIIALKIVSAMEISEVMPSFTYKWAEENPEDFKDILYRFGMNVNMGFETEPNITHRTILNRVVTCDRYIGNERIDKEWIASGWASREAKDKSSGSKLLNDIYRMKGLS